MKWYKRDIEPLERYEAVVNEFSKLLGAGVVAANAVLGIDRKPGQPGTLYARLPSDSAASRLGFRPSLQPLGGMVLAGDPNALEVQFPRKRN